MFFSHMFIPDPDAQTTVAIQEVNFGCICHLKANMKLKDWFRKQPLLLGSTMKLRHIVCDYPKISQKMSRRNSFASRCEKKQPSM